MNRASLLALYSTLIICGFFSKEFVSFGVHPWRCKSKVDYGPEIANTYTCEKNSPSPSIKQLMRQDFLIKQCSINLIWKHIGKSLEQIEIKLMLKFKKKLKANYYNTKISECLYHKNIKKSCTRINSLWEEIQNQE